mgnify:CR=1 FL=1|tara:strand:- start:807 stop:2066 length:1260 start_codon:yes stop_codon:yes gene_type:complete
MPQLQASSNKVTFRSVAIKVEFVIRNTTASETVEYKICELGKFTYDFAVTTDVDNIDKIGIRSGAITISFFDNDSATSYKSIYDAYFDTTDPQTELTTNIKIFNPSTTGTADVIKCRFNNQDISYDINQRKTTINFQPIRPSDVASVSITSLISASTKLNKYSDSTESALLVRDFIDEALDSMFGSSGTNVVVTNFSALNPSLGSDVFFVFQTKQDSESTTLNVFEQLANIAGVEGSVYGNMLGKKVYFARNITGGQTVAMSESDFKSLKLQNPKKSKYSQLKVTHGNGFFSESTSSVINPDADKTANFSFRQGNVDRRDVTNTSLFFCDTNSLFSNAATVFGLASYEKVLLDTQIPTLSGTFFGVNKVLPHQCMVISFASGSIGGTRLINPINGTYRFSKVTYDLFNDTVDFQAYKIA